MTELKTLIEEEIPDGRKALLESHQNLQKVSAYCTQKYLNEADKKKVLEETKNFTTQSLASVAYQINTLANNMLSLLDIHAVQLANMESSLNVISQTVDIHKEKVARREIGLLTNTKNVTRNQRIIYPSIPDRAVKYIRKPIDYTECDDIGHGVKLNNRSDSGTMRRHSSINKKPASPNPDRVSSDLNKSGSVSGYGTLRAVKAPTVPQDFNHSQRISSLTSQHRRTNSNSSSGSGSIASGQFGVSRAPSVNIPAPPSVNMSIPPAPAMSSSIPPPPPISSSVPPPPPIASSIPAPPPVSASIPPPPPVNIPAPPPLNSGIPPPPALQGNLANNPSNVASPVMHPPPPPSIAPQGTNFRTSDTGYSTPVVGANNMAASVQDNADSYATTSIMDLPPPPSTDMSMPPPPPLDATMLPPPPMMSDAEPSWVPKEYIEKMVVIYDYAANNIDELDLKEDQIVYVVKMNADGWYEGVIDGVTGLFPGNYVDSLS